ncbi:MAG: VOC family protein [Kineosporiaceae bacterium]
MRLENIAWDARDPQRLGRFWSAALDASPLSDGPDLVEARMPLADGAFLDLCFQRVPDPSRAPARLHLDLRGGADQAAVVERLLALGARHADIGQGAVPWVVLADPEGNAFCVMEERAVYRDTGPIAALPLDSADLARDAEFWAAVTGWVPWDGMTWAATLRHPSGTGPLLELCPEREPRRGKNRLHLDVRRDPGSGDPTDQLLALGARRLSAPGEFPWIVFADPSGNELCVLPPVEPTPD